ALTTIGALAGATLLGDRSFAAAPIKVAGVWSVPVDQQWASRLHIALKAAQAARRELVEETGITQGRLCNLQWTQVYEILRSFGKKYAPGVTRNLAHAFALKLPGRVPV